MTMFTLANVRPSAVASVSLADRRDRRSGNVGFPPPPFGITGAITPKTQKTIENITSSKYTLDYLSSVITRPLTLLVDWVRCTFKPVVSDDENAETNVERAMRLFGGSLGLKWSVDRGRWMYEQSYRRGDVHIHFGGNSGNCTVDVSGKGCRQLEAEGVIDSGEGMPEVGFFTGWQGFIGSLVDNGAKFTRVDWAFDDRSNMLSLQTMLDYSIAGQCSTLMKNAKPHFDVPLSGSGLVLQGVTFGSRKSMLEVRAYDKRLERLSAGDNDPGQWTRLELETHDEKAQAVCEIFSKYGVLSVVQDLSANLDFKERGGGDIAHRYRWKRAGWWSKFLSDAEKCRISVAPKLRSLEGTARFFADTWASTFAAIMAMPDLGEKWLRGVLKTGMERWKNKHIELMRTHLLGLGESDALDFISGLLDDPDANAKSDHCKSCGVHLVSNPGKHDGYSPIPLTCRACWVIASKGIVNA